MFQNKNFYLLGRQKLLDHNLNLSENFKELISLLIDLDELDPQARGEISIEKLNKIFQKPQGEGGLLRKPGTERWHLKDSQALKDYREQFMEYFKKLGFFGTDSIDEPISVNHTIIFGARVGRMAKRIKETTAYLNENLQTENIFLFGSNRLLEDVEVDDLEVYLGHLSSDRREYWTHFFSQPGNYTEGYALLYLWECLGRGSAELLQATKIGYSYRDTEGDRPTTESTVEEWLLFYDSTKPQSIFALTEEPYIRLADQFRVKVLTKNGAATQQEVIDRIDNTVFYFPIVKGDPDILVSIVLDEIGRNFYMIKNVLLK